MSLADFIRVEGYKVSEVYKHLDQGYVLIALAPTSELMACRRCSSALTNVHGRHRIRAKFLPVFSYEAYFVCWRRKGICEQCKKIRSEALDFLSLESPHLTKAYESTSKS